MAKKEASESTQLVKWLACALSLALIVVATLFVLWWDKFTTDEDSTVGAGASGKQVESDSVCGLPAGEQAMPTWHIPVDRFEIKPGSSFLDGGKDKLGPGKRDGVIPTCYAHSPQGAVLAVANYEAAQANADDMAELYRKLVVQDENGKKWLGYALNTTGEGTENPKDYASAFIIHGYKITEVGHDEYQVEIALSLQANPDWGVIAMQDRVKWVDGDWKIVMPPQFIQPYRVSELRMNSFVPWKV